ncbi:MAG: hypothetical protein LUE86_08300 [Clostridiales bacterium]|nr:hypothetical protein [Clostridiales bacterium]
MSKINTNKFFTSARKVPMGKIRAFANSYTNFLVLRDEYTVEDTECIKQLDAAFGLLSSIDSIAVKAGETTMFSGFVGSIEEKIDVIEAIDLAVRKRLVYQAITTV